MAIGHQYISEICETMKTNILFLMAAKSGNGKFFNCILFSNVLFRKTTKDHPQYQISQKYKKRKRWKKWKVINQKKKHFTHHVKRAYVSNVQLSILDIICIEFFPSLSFFSFFFHFRIFGNIYNNIYILASVASSALEMKKDKM